jgi:fimbrial isopeptide formation D2 family protein/uncharacterized repeat protein (TIGR01451 family)
LKVQNTGIGAIRDVKVGDTLGIGLSWVSFSTPPAEPSPYPNVVTWSSVQIPALSDMDVDEEVTITAVALVNSCENLTNALDASFGCLGLGEVPDQTCKNTATETPPQTASAAVEHVLKPPDLTFNVSGLTNIPYCSFKTVTVTLTNGDPGTPDPDVGPAQNLVLVMAGLPSEYEITNVIGASYDPLTGRFTVGDIPANTEYEFTFDINWKTGECPPAGSATTLWSPEYEDECGNPFRPPHQLYPVSLTGLPSLSITKNNPGIVQGDETITFTVQVNYNGPNGFTPTVTDTYPKPSPGWTIANITGGGVNNGTTITWTPTLNDGDTWSASFDMWLPDPCAGPPEGFYTNNANVTGGMDCRNCTIPGSSSSATFYLESTPGCDGQCNVDGTRSGGGTAEVCTDVSYTNSYALSGTGLPATWMGATMTDSMPLGQAIKAPTSLVAVTVNGSDYTSYASDSVVGGVYTVDLSGLNGAPGCPKPNAASTLVISYTLAADDTTGTAYSRSSLNLSGCAAEINWIAVTIARSSVSIGLSGPQILDRCGRETYTMALGKNAYIVYDLAVVFNLDPDGDNVNNYEYEPGSTVFTGTFTESGGGAITAFEPDMTTEPHKLLWDFSTQGSGSGDLSSVGSIKVDLRLPCGQMVDTYAAEARYNDRCDNGVKPQESTATAGPNSPMLIVNGDIVIYKAPETYYAAQDTAVWTFTVVNGGDGAAYNLTVTDTLEADLRYNASSVTPASVVPPPPAGGNTIVWDFHSLAAPLGGLQDLDGDGYYDDLIAGGTVTFTLTADVIGCDDLDDQVYATWGCLSSLCQTSATDTSTVKILSDSLVDTATFPADMPLCSTAQVVIDVRNSGQTHLYDLEVREEFPRPNPGGIFYQAGSSQYQYWNGSVWSGWAAISDPSGSGTQADPYVWTGASGIAQFGDLSMGWRVQIRYTVSSDCDFVTSDRTFRTRTHYHTSCGEEEVTSQREAILKLDNMHVTVVKEVSTAAGGPWQTADMPFSNGDTVYWRVTLTSDGETPAQNVKLVDQFPADVDYTGVASGPGPDTVTGGPGGETLTWNAPLTLPFQVVIQGTVISCGSPSCNEATASWGCQSPNCTSESDSDSQCLLLRPNLSTTNDLTSFTTCNGTIAFSVTNTGAKAEAIDIDYTLPSGYLYDSTAGGAEIVSSDPSHTFTEGEEEPGNPTGSPIVFASTLNGGNINPGNDYVNPGETLTVTFKVYRDPTSGQCDSDPNTDPPPPPEVTGSAAGTYKDTCGGGPYAITFVPDSITPTYPDLDITVLPLTQIVPNGGTATWNVTLRNNGTAPATHYTVTHTLAGGYSNAWNSVTGSTGNTFSLTESDLGPVAPGAPNQKVYTVTATVGTGSLVHDYEVVGPCQYADGTDTTCRYSWDTGTVYAANFGSSKAPASQTATIGETVTFTITANFQNPTYANAVITDTLPTPGLEYISYTIVSGPTPAFSQAGGVLTFDYGTISSATTAVIDLVARVDDIPGNVSGVTQTNSVTTSFTYEGRPYTEDHTADVDIVEPRLVNPVKTSSKGASPLQVKAGDTVPFTLTFNNNLTSAAYNAVVTDTLPAEMRDTDPTGLAYSIVITNGVTPRTLTPATDYTAVWNGGTGALTFTFLTATKSAPAAIAAGETVTISFIGTVDSDVGSGVSFTNSFNVGDYDSLPDPICAGNPDCRDYSDGTATFNLYTADVDIQKAIVRGSPAAIGETVAYKLTVTVPAESNIYWPLIRDRIYYREGFQYVTGTTILTDVSGNPVTPASFRTSSDPTVDYTTPNPGATFEWALNTIDNADPGSPQGNVPYVFTIEFDVLVTGKTDAGGWVWPTPGANDYSLDTGQTKWDWTDEGPKQWSNLDDEDDSLDVRTDVDQPRLASLSKTTTTVSPVQGGQQVNYRITVSNTGWNTAFDTVFTDVIPIGMRDTTPAIDSITVGARTLAAGTDYSTAYDGTTFTVTFISSSTSLPVSTNASASRIRVGETATINYHTTVDLTVGAGWSMTDSARMTGYTSLPGTYPDERTYTGLGPSTRTHTTAACTVAKSRSPATPTIGETVIYTFDIDVPTATWAYNLGLADNYVPDGLTVTNVTCSPSGTPSWSEEGDGRTRVTAAFGDVLGAAGIDRTVTIYAYVDQTYSSSACIVRGNTFRNPTSFASIYWADRPGGVITDEVYSNVVSNTVVEPTLDISKDANPAHGDAGDTVTFTVTVSHNAQSNAIAYDVNIADVIPSGMTYADNLTAVSGPLPVESGTPPNKVFSYTDVPLGSTYSFRFDATLDNSVEPGDVITNTADLTWTSLPGDEPHERTGDGTGCNTYNDSDTADVTVDDTMALAKTLLGDGTAVIGETFQYRVTATLIEGTMSNVTLTDTLDTGLAFVSQDSVVYDPSITISGSTTPVVGPDGETLTWNLGTVMNPAGPAPDTITFTYTVCVTNITLNQNGQTRNNAARLTYDGGGPLAAAAANTTIQEPALTIQKDAVPTTGDAGDTVTITLTLYHTPASTATAYDVEITDVIPAGMVWNNNVQSINGPAPTVNTAGNPTIVFSWTDIPTTYVSGNPVQFSFEVMLDNSVEPGETITNTADLEWTSLSGDPGQVSPYNSNAYERTGDPADPGEENDYNGSDSADVTVDDTMTLSKTLLGDGTAVIGETFQYEVVVGLIEGTMSSVVLTDTLDTGLAYVRQDSVVYDPSITISGSTVPVVGPNGETLTWNLGTVVNPAGPAADTVTFTYTVCVTNITLNQNGQTRNNAARLTYDGGGPLDAAAANTTIQEPALTIQKGAVPATGDAGDVITVTVTLNHTAGSTATAYDVEITDVIPAGMEWADNVQSLNGPAPTVNSGGDPTIVFSWTGIPTSYNAANPVQFTFDVTLADDVTPNQLITNTANLEWTSLPGNPGQVSPYNTNAYERTGDPADPGEDNNYNGSDDAQVTVNDLALSKTLLGDGDAAVGETFQYRVTVTLIEGEMESITLQDTLDEGLAFVNQDSVQVDPSITISGSTTPDGPTLIASQGRTLLWNLGNITDPPDPSKPDTITFTYTVVVLNVIGNQTGTLLNNGVRLTYTGGGPKDAAAADTAVLEPDLTITKDVAPLIAESGETVTVTLYVSHTPDSDTTAHNVVVEDVLPGATLVPPKTVYADNVTVTSEVASPPGPPLPTYTVDTSGLPGSIRLLFDTIPTDFDDTNRIVITFDVVVGPGVTPPETLTNNSEVTWTSIPDPPGPGPLSPYNADSVERDGSDGPGGALNDYAAVAQRDINISNTSALVKTLLGPTTAVIGETFQYKIDYKVFGGTNANVVLEDTLDPGLAYVQLDSVTYDNTNITITPPPGSDWPNPQAALLTSSQGHTVRWEMGTVVDNGGPNDIITFTYTVVVLNVSGNVKGTPGTKLNNVASLTSEAGPLGPISADEVEVHEPELVITKETSQTDISPGDIVLFTLTLSHTAASNAPARDIVVTDTIPPEFSILPFASDGVDNDGDTLVDAADPDEGAVAGQNVTFNQSNWNLPGPQTHSFADLPLGYSITMKVRGTVLDLPPGTMVTNTARAEWTSLPGDPGQVSPYNSNAYERTGDPADPGELNNYNDEDTTPVMTVRRVDLRIEKTDGVDYASPSNVLTYTLSITNTNAANVTATGVAVTDVIPPNTTYQGSSDGGSYTPATRTVSWPLFSLAVDETVTRTVTVRVDDPQPVGSTSITNWCYVTDDGTHGPDLNPGDESDDDTDQLRFVDLAVVKTDNVDLFLTGETLAYVLTYNNYGAADAPNSQIIDTIPTNTTYEAGLTSCTGCDSIEYSTAGPGGPWDPEPPTGTPNVTIRFFFNNLAGGASGTAGFTVRVNTTLAPPPPPATVVNTAVISYDNSNGQDIDPSNNTSTDTDQITHAALGDTVWFDYNGDGVQQPNEPGLQNIAVTLTGDIDGDGDTETVTKYTDPFGHYEFTDLYPGEFTVKVSQTDPRLPAGSVITTPDTVVHVLQSGEYYPDADFGFRVPPVAGAIGDFVWNDWNNNGVQDAGEPDFSGVTVELWKDGALVGTATTDAVGHYLFEGLSAGNYEVRVTDTAGVLAGYTHTLGPDSKPVPFPYSLASGEVYLGADFGYYKEPPLSAIGDRVWLDLDGDGVQDPGEEGITGVTVELRDASGTPIATATTDVNGHYLFTGLADGEYTVVVTDTAHVLDGYDATTPTTVTHTLGVEEEYLEADFGYVPQWPDPLLGSIGDTVWYDLDRDGIVDPGEAGIPGVTVWLKNEQGQIIATAVTDALGHYLFPDLPAGTYVVDVDESTIPAGYELTTANDPMTVNLAAGEEYVLADFGYAPFIPTPTPTVTPTPPNITPTPTPTPCFCSEATLEVSHEVVTAGTTLTIGCCIPVHPVDPVDIYVVVITPRGDYWSILYGGAVVKGIVPIAEGYLNPSCWCGPIKEHTVCAGSLPGRYIVALAILPAGAKPVKDNALVIDWTYVLVNTQ